MVIIQILPALVLGLYTRWFYRWALVAGWFAGMGLSVYMLYVTASATSKHCGSASFALSKWGSGLLRRGTVPALAFPAGEQGQGSF